MREAYEKLKSGLGRFLSEKWRQDVKVESMSRIPGGASRETWRCDVYADSTFKGVIVRIDPPSSLIDTDRRTEYLATCAAHRAGIPVPEPLFLEQDPSWIGRPFSVSSEIEGCDAAADKFPEKHLTRIGARKWQILGEIAALDIEALGLNEFMPGTTRNTCAMEQLQYWKGVILDDEIHPNPVAHAAIRWLESNPPPPARKLSLVHGDFRSGNFLYTPEGEISAVLDWEMAHIGDPLEDLGWSFDPLWSWGNPALAGSLLPHEVAISHWEQASGMKVDRDAFWWWQVFNAVKGIGIWISSSEEFDKGPSKDAILALAGWLVTDRQQQVLLDYLSPHSRKSYWRARG